MTDGSGWKDKQIKRFLSPVEHAGTVPVGQCHYFICADIVAV